MKKAYILLPEDCPGLGYSVIFLKGNGNEYIAMAHIGTDYDGDDWDTFPAEEIIDHVKRVWIKL